MMTDIFFSQEKQDLMNEISRLTYYQEHTSTFRHRKSEQRDSSYLDDIHQERVRLAIIEQKIKQILTVLKSLTSMVKKYPDTIHD